MVLSANKRARADDGERIRHLASVVRASRAASKNSSALDALVDAAKSAVVLD